MSDTLIKNLQIGDQTYKLQATSKESNTKRGDSFISEDYYEDYAYSYKIVRPNAISSIHKDNSVFMVGLPHEYIQESGQFVMFGENFGILNRNSSDIEGYPYKLTVLMNSIRDNLDDWMYPNTDITYTHKVSVYWNDSNSYDYCLSLYTLDGNLIEYYWSGESLVQDLMYNIHEASNICVFIRDNSLYIRLYDQYEGDENNAGISIYNGYGHEIDATLPLMPGQWWENILFLYFGSATMEVNPVSHYMFNVTTSTSLITNIPLTWSQDITPEFGMDKLVQISVLDGVGTFNSISLQS